MSTIADLDAEIRSLHFQIAALGGTDIFGNDNNGNYREENARIEKYLSEFTSRQGVLLTIAGLLTLLPIADKNQLQYLLCWSLPFLICAIACYIFSAKRINFVSSVNAAPLNHREINSKLKSEYLKSVKFYRATDSIVIIFFVSFILNFYLLNFFGSINLISSILVTLSSVCLGCARLEYVGEFLKNKLPNQYGVGGDINMVPMTPTPETKY